MNGHNARTECRLLPRVVLAPAAVASAVAAAASLVVLLLAHR